MAAQFNLRAKEYLDSADSKREFNLQHFTESAPRYDIATRILSLGRDAAWKQELIRALPEMQSPVCVDIACGTGDVAFALARRYPHAEILGTDLTQAMIDIANRRNTFSNVRFLACDMSRLDLQDNSVDILTGSYAIRNAATLEDALAEVHRVLKPGAIAAFLDFSKPKSSSAQKVQYYLLKFWGGLCGLLLHANPEVHGYIAASIKKFPDREKLKQIFEQKGFELVKKKKLYCGMLEILLLSKCK